MERRLACSRSAFNVTVAVTASFLTVTSRLDPVEENEAGTSSESPGLEVPELEPRKTDLCGDKQLRRCSMAPD